jgi:hypothetical protein
VSGYAATGRIRGATPRLVEPGRDLWLISSPGFPAVEELAEVEAGAGDRLPSPAPTVSERWESVRERWSQLTFYVFSSEFWD